MKNYNWFSVMHKDVYAMRYLSGVPMAEKRLYWGCSPWNAVRLILQRG